MQSDKSEDVDRGVRVYVPFVRVIQVLQKNRPNKASIILDVYDVHTPPDTVCVPASSSSSSSSSSGTQVVKVGLGRGRQDGHGSRCCSAESSSSLTATMWSRCCRYRSWSRMKCGILVRWKTASCLSLSTSSKDTCTGEEEGSSVETRTETSPGRDRSYLHIKLSYNLSSVCL